MIQEEIKPPNTIDQAIARCEKIISDHSKSATNFFLSLIVTTVFFILFLSIPIIARYFKPDAVAISKGTEINNNYLKKLDADGSINFDQYDSIINKVIVYQKLLNAENEQNISYKKSTEAKQEINLNDYLIYAAFVLFFSVFASLYRFHLKEISRQEHYLVGFQRIRIAGSNLKTYNDLVLIALTKNAFFYEPNNKHNSSKSIESPIQGHPASDFVVDALNKILEKFDLTPRVK